MRGNQNAATHSMVTLAALIKKGLSDEHPVGRILSERRETYVRDLGGPDNCSGMEASICEKLARLDLHQALLDSRVVDPTSGKARHMSWSKAHAVSLLQARLTDSFVRAASALGIKRREKLTPDLRVLLAEAQEGNDA